MTQNVWRVLNLINKLVLVGKFLTRAEIKFFIFHSGSVREFPNASQPETSQEEDVPECSRREISQIFPGNIRFSGNTIRERRPLAQG